MLGDTVRVSVGFLVGSKVGTSERESEGWIDDFSVGEKCCSKDGEFDADTLGDMEATVGVPVIATFAPEYDDATNFSGSVEKKIAKQNAPSRTDKIHGLCNKINIVSSSSCSRAASNNALQSSSSCLMSLESSYAGVIWEADGT